MCLLLAENTVIVVVVVVVVWWHWEVVIVELVVFQACYQALVLFAKVAAHQTRLANDQDVRGDREASGLIRQVRGLLLLLLLLGVLERGCLCLGALPLFGVPFGCVGARAFHARRHRRAVLGELPLSTLGWRSRF